MDLKILVLLSANALVDVHNDHGQFNFPGDSIFLFSATRWFRAHHTSPNLRRKNSLSKLVVPEMTHRFYPVSVPLDLLVLKRKFHT